MSRVRGTCDVSTVLNLGSEVRFEKLVELFVIILGKVDRFLLAPVLAVQDQVGVVVEDPLDLYVRILVDTAPLLEEPLDAGQPIEPSGASPLFAYRISCHSPFANEPTASGTPSSPSSFTRMWQRH